MGPADAPFRSSPRPSWARRAAALFMYASRCSCVRSSYSAGLRRDVTRLGEARRSSGRTCFTRERRCRPRLGRTSGRRPPWPHRRSRPPPARRADDARLGGLAPAAVLGGLAPADASQRAAGGEGLEGRAGCGAAARGRHSGGLRRVRQMRMAGRLSRAGPFPPGQLLDGRGKRARRRRRNGSSCTNREDRAITIKMNLRRASVFTTAYQFAAESVFVSSPLLQHKKLKIISTLASAICVAWAPSMVHGSIGGKTYRHTLRRPALGLDRKTAVVRQGVLRPAAVIQADPLLRRDAVDGQRHLRA